MELSLKDRWMLANQCRILEGLYPAEAGEFRRARLALERGYEYEYDALVYEAPIWAETFGAASCLEVLDILEMFFRMKLSYAVLEDKAGVEARWIEFPGFDGNLESSQLVYAQYVCDDCQRFEGLNVENSHHPMLGCYRRMKAAWELSADKGLLTREDFIRINVAQYPPAPR